MKSQFKLMTAAGLFLAMAVPGLAQTVGVAVSVAPEARTHTKEYVVRERVAPIIVKERIAAGAKLPADSELRAVPSTWVEPSSREMVQVID